MCFRVNQMLSFRYTAYQLFNSIEDIQVRKINVTVVQIRGNGCRFGQFHLFEMHLKKRAMIPKYYFTTLACLFINPQKTEMIKHSIS